MTTLAGYVVHGLLALAGGVLMLRPRGRLLLPLAVWLLVLLLGVGWDVARGLERIVIIGGVVGMYQIAVRLPAVWRRRGLAAAGWLAVVLTVVRFATVQLLADPRQWANMLAAWLLLTWPYISWCAASPALLLTYTRGAWVAASAALIIQRRWWWLWFLLAAMSVFLLNLRWGTVDHRLTEWRAAADMLERSSYIFGAGTGAYWDTGLGEHADSLPFTLAAEGGVIGLLPLAAVIGELWRMRRGWAAWALLAFGLSELTDATLLMPWTGLIAAVLAAEMEMGNDDNGVRAEGAAAG